MKTTTVDEDYDKEFITFIDEHIRGISQAYGPRDHDDFDDYIENAYQNSLIYKKILKYIKLLIYSIIGRHSFFPLVTFFVIFGIFR